MMTTEDNNDDDDEEEEEEDEQDILKSFHILYLFDILVYWCINRRLTLFPFSYQQFNFFTRW